jgi:tetratricopeptide (TPR) repeat protein/DNA-binding SARP family transcriptional activator
MNDLICVNLLGEFAVSNSQGVGVKFHSKLERSLVAYLGFYQQAHDRDQLTDVFWSLERSDKGRKNLSQLMWRVSQSIGQDVFLADRDSVQLEPSKLLVDLSMVRRQLAGIGEQHDPSMVQSLIAVSQKQLLKGFSEDWMLEARDEWQVELNAGLRKLEHLAEMAGAFEVVIALARAQIRLEPLNERANTSVIRTCLVLGRSSEARDHFEHFRRSLADIGEEVSGKMRVLGERIQSGQSRSNISARSSLEVGAGLRMVGRSLERERCLKAIAEAKLGAGRMILIEGEPGIGKTKLIQSLIDDATWRGQNVLRAAAQEWRQLEPYGVIQEMLSDNLGSLRLEMVRTQLAPVWLQEAARVIPKLLVSKNSSVTPEDHHDSQRLRESLLEVFKTLARIQPLAVFIDDLQWTDESSLELLIGLERILESLPIVVVIGFRSLEARGRRAVWQCIESLDRHALTTRVQLEALKREKIKEMVQKALGIALLPEVVTHLEQVSQGNPMFVLETLKVLLETGIALEDQSLWMNRLKTMPLATGLREVIVSRLSRLEPKTREVIQLSAVIGARFEFELLQGLTQIPTVELLDILDALIQAGFLQEIEPGFGFAHDQLRQTIYDQLPETECSQLHWQILQTFQGEDSIPPEVLASHAERAKQFGLATRYRLKSAEHSLALHSYPQALQDLQAIGDLAQTDFDTDEQIRFLEARIRADGAQNSFERMLLDMTSLDALLEHQPSKRLELICRRAKTLASIGRTPEALALIDQAQLEGVNLDAFDQAQVLIAKGGVFLAGGGPFDLALEPLILAVQLCVDHQLNLETEAHSNLGRAYSQLARFEQALEEYQMALRLAEQDGDLYREAVTLGRIARCYCSQGYDRQAIPSLERAITLTRTLGLRLEEVKNLTSLGLIEYKIGNVSKGINTYDQALALSKSIGAKWYEAFILGSTAFLKHLHCDPEKARLQLHSALEIHQESSDREGQGYILSQLGLLHHWGGQLEHADHFLRQALDLLAQIKDLVGELNALLWLVENMILDGRFAEAREMACDGLVRSKSHHLPDQEFQFKRLIANIAYLNKEPQVALETLQDCLPESGVYLGIEIDGFYRFHLLHFKILNALNDPTQALVALRQAHRYSELELQNYPASQRVGWRKAVPFINEILSLCEQYFEHKVSVRLASKDAPTGRTLQENEFLNLTWVVRKPEDDQILDKTKRRQHQLERLCIQALEQGALPTVEDLANALNTSVATIKRDLAALRAANVHLSTRGARISP